MARARQAGAEPLLVGGAVRDALLTGAFPRDFDIEIRVGDGDTGGFYRRLSGARSGLSLRELSFGVARVRLPDGSEVEMCPPRRDVYGGPGPFGHSDFQAVIDHRLGVRESFARRDLTINALGMDPDGVLVDPLGGLADLEARRARPCSGDFFFDPVRFARLVRFRLRFSLGLDAEMEENLGRFDLSKLTAHYFFKEALGAYPSSVGPGNFSGWWNSTASALGAGSKRWCFWAASTTATSTVRRAGSSPPWPRRAWRGSGSKPSAVSPPSRRNPCRDGGQNFPPFLTWLRKCVPSWYHGFSKGNCSAFKGGRALDIHTVLASHKSKQKKKGDGVSEDFPGGGGRDASSIPDIFFDDILTTYKLTRIDVLVLMYLYRYVWCRPNLYKLYGISPLLSLASMAERLGITMEENYASLRNLESYGFISMIRLGQYFVRKYFTKEWDEYFTQTYDDFEG